MTVNLARRLANKLAKIRSILNNIIFLKGYNRKYQLIAGANSRFTSNVKVYNHLNDPKLIRIGNGVFIEDTLGLL